LKCRKTVKRKTPKGINREESNESNLKLKARQNGQGIKTKENDKDKSISLPVLSNKSRKGSLRREAIHHSPREMILLS